MTPPPVTSRPGSEPVYLCLTQSPLITMVFQAAMSELQVGPERVRSISRRGVKPAGRGLSLDDLSDGLEQAYRKLRRGRYRDLLAELRQQVAELTDGRDFLVYLPHVQRLMYQEILALPRCLGYVFVEEGFTSMSWETHQQTTIRPAKKLQAQLRAAWTGSAYRLDRLMFDVADPGFRGAVALSQHAFHGMPQVSRVGQWVRRYRHEGGPRRLFVVLDTSYLHRGIAWQAYAEALVAALLEESAGRPPVFIKFHFVDGAAAERFAALKQRLEAAGAGEVTRLERDFSVEEALTADDRVLFAVSSLGYFVSLFGGAVKCFAPEVAGLSVDAWIAKGALPADFREVVGLPEHRSENETS